MARIVSDQLPAFSIYFNLDVAAHLATLQGPTAEGVTRRTCGTSRGGSCGERGVRSADCGLRVEKPG